MKHWFNRHRRAAQSGLTPEQKAALAVMVGKYHAALDTVRSAHADILALLQGEHQRASVEETVLTYLAAVELAQRYRGAVKGHSAELANELYVLSRTPVIYERIQRESQAELKAEAKRLSASRAIPPEQVGSAEHPAPNPSPEASH